MISALKTEGVCLGGGGGGGGGGGNMRVFSHIH